MTTPIITSGYNLKTDPSASSLAGLKTMNKGVAQYNAYNALSNADLRRAQRKAGRIDNGFINNDLGGASGVVGLASSVIDMGKDIANRAKGPDMTNDLLNVKDQANAQYKDTGFDSLNQTWQNNSLLLHKNKYDFGYKNGWQRFKDFNVDGIKGFMKGFGATGNPWVGLGVAAANQISGLWAGNQGNKKAERASKRYNLLADDANTRNQLNFNNQLANIQRNQQRSLDTNYAAYGGFFNFGSGANSFSLATDRTNTSRLNAASKNKITSLPNSFEPMKQMQPMQSFAFGGNLESNGMTVDAGFSKINNGGTHEENPNQGVQIGIDNQGTPNLLEEGEVLYGNFVFSKRLKAPKSLIKKYGYGVNEIPFSKLAEKILKEKEEKPNDPIVKATTESILKEVADTQMKIKDIQHKIMEKTLEQKLTSEEKMMIQQMIQEGIEKGVQEKLQQMQGQQAPQDPSMMQGGDPNQMDPAMQEQMMQQQMAQQGGGQMPPEAMQGGVPQEMAFGGSLYAYGGNLFAINGEMDRYNPKAIKGIRTANSTRDPYGFFTVGIDNPYAGMDPSVKKAVTDKVGYSTMMPLNALMGSNGYNLNTLLSVPAYRDAFYKMNNIDQSVDPNVEAINRYREGLSNAAVNARAEALSKQTGNSTEKWNPVVQAPGYAAVKYTPNTLSGIQAAAAQREQMVGPNGAGRTVKPATTTDQKGLSNDEIIKQVIRGKWGNGAERRKRLTDAGYDYDSIRQGVNAKLTGSKTSATPVQQVLGTSNTQDVQPEQVATQAVQPAASSPVQQVINSAEIPEYYKNAPVGATPYPVAEDSQLTQAVQPEVQAPQSSNIMDYTKMQQIYNHLGRTNPAQAKAVRDSGLFNNFIDMSGTFAYGGDLFADGGFLGNNVKKKIYF